MSAPGASHASSVPASPSAPGVSRGRSALASPSATTAALKRFGLYTKKSLGQHFLIDNNVIEKTLALAAVTPDDVVVEVGPGLGTLTLALVHEARAVVAVERDPSLLGPVTTMVGEELGIHAAERFALIEDDATKVTPTQVGAPFGSPTALVANLPYQVAATIVLRTFEEFSSVRSVTVMVQLEVAQRMSASVGTKAYGAYTAKLRLLAQPRDLFTVARNSFLPPPRVDSAVIRLDAAPLVSGPEEYAAVARVIDAAFTQRRKTVRNSLVAGLRMAPAAVDRALQAAGIEPTRRAETIEPALFITLAREMQ